MEWGSDAVTATAVVVPSGDAAAAAGEVKVATVVEAKADGTVIVKVCACATHHA